MPPGDSKGWFRCVRSDEALELVKANRCALVLLFVIAQRARWKEGFNLHNLRKGEAHIGDHDDCGLSEQEYRTAKKHLEKWGFATFKPTNKGTIATLSSSTVFDLGSGDTNEQNHIETTGIQRANNESPTDSQRLTNNVKREEGKKRLDGERSSLNRSVERELMAELAEMLGEDEMARCGGMWRKDWVRVQPSWVRDGLALMRLKLKEGESIDNRGAWLTDYLQRRGKELAN